MAEYELDPSKTNFSWNNALEPALHNQPGDTVHCWTQEVSNGEIIHTSTAADLTKSSFGFHYPLAGPIYVEGAEPDDALEIAILEMHPDDTGAGMLSRPVSVSWQKSFLDLTSNIGIYPMAGQPNLNRESSFHWNHFVA